VQRQRSSPGLTNLGSPSRPLELQGRSGWASLSIQGQRQEAGLSAWGLAVEWLGGAACVHRAR